MVATHDTTDTAVRTPDRLPIVDPHIDRIYVLNMRTPGLRTDSWLSWHAEQEAHLTFGLGMDAAAIEAVMGGDEPS